MSEIYHRSLTDGRKSNTNVEKKYISEHAQKPPDTMDSSYMPSAYGWWFLTEGQDFDYSMTEVARGAGVGWSAFTRIWKKLLDKAIILPTREIGNAKLFKLNKANPFVKKLIKLDWELTKLETDKLLSKKVIEV